MIILCSLKLRETGKTECGTFDDQSLSDRVLEFGKLILSQDCPGVSLDALNLFFVALYQCFSAEIIENFIRQEIGVKMTQFLHKEINSQGSRLAIFLKVLKYFI